MNAKTKIAFILIPIVLGFAGYFIGSGIERHNSEITAKELVDSNRQLSKDLSDTRIQLSDISDALQAAGITVSQLDSILKNSYGQSGEIGKGLKRLRDAISELSD